MKKQQDQQMDVSHSKKLFAIKNMFDKYDADKSGAIDKQEFALLMHDMRLAFPLDKFPNNEIMIKLVDKDNSGSISYVELVSYFMYEHERAMTNYSTTVHEQEMFALKQRLFEAEGNKNNLEDEVGKLREQLIRQVVEKNKLLEAATLGTKASCEAEQLRLQIEQKNAQIAQMELQIAQQSAEIQLLTEQLDKISHAESVMNAQYNADHSRLASLEKELLYYKRKTEFLQGKLDKAMQRLSSYDCPNCKKEFSKPVTPTRANNVPNVFDRLYEVKQLCVPEPEFPFAPTINATSKHFQDVSPTKKKLAQ